MQVRERCVRVWLVEEMVLAAREGGTAHCKHGCKCCTKMEVLAFSWGQRASNYRNGSDAVTAGSVWCFDAVQMRSDSGSR